MAGLIFYYLDAKVSERMLHLTAESPRGGIGIRVRLRTVSRKGCRFNSCRGHQTGKATACTERSRNEPRRSKPQKNPEKTIGSNHILIFGGKKF